MWCSVGVYVSFYVSRARQGGYTRILKADFRQGDGAEMAVIEYIDRCVFAYLPVHPVHVITVMLTHCFSLMTNDRPGEMRKAKPPQGIAAVNAAFEAQAAEAQ